MAFKNLKRDLARIYGPKLRPVTIARAALNPSVLAVACVRVATSRNKLVHALGRLLGLTLFGIDIGYRAEIAPGLYLPHPISIVIGQGVVVGEDATIYQGVTLGNINGKYPTLGNDVTVYPNAIIIGHVSVAHGKKIPPASVLRP